MDDGAGGGAGPGMDGVPPPPPLSEEARTWAAACLERLRSADPAVRRSAAEALRALGPPAVPLLREARDAADGDLRTDLDRILGAIAKGPGPKEPGRRPGAPGAKPGGDGKAPGDGKPSAMAFLDRVREDLALDDATYRTVADRLLLFGRDAREVLMDARDGLITYEDARTRVGDLRAALRDEMGKTLSAEQVTRLDALLDEQARRLGGGGAKPKPEKPPPAPAR
jgi:hypothetical protein